ncbi:MAG: hypothetical protein HUJ54_08190 [Erysipelotrichaceae bacterium]|nr:hypothetical protein [Erysipelotrichaceae bacterium]
MRLYKINVNTKEIRNLMKDALRHADKGDLESARSMFLMADEQIAMLKEEAVSARAHDDELRQAVEEDGSIQFTELVKDVLSQAAEYQNAACSPIRYHVYS